MKRLYDEKDQYNAEGLKLRTSSRKALTKLVDKYADEGFSLLDIQSVINHQIDWLINLKNLGLGNYD